MEPVFQNSLKKYNGEVTNVSKDVDRFYRNYLYDYFRLHNYEVF